MFTLRWNYKLCDALCVTKYIQISKTPSNEAYLMSQRLISTLLYRAKTI